MRPRGPRIRPSRPDLAHEVRRGHHGVEVEEAALDPLDQIVGTDVVGAGRPGLFGAVAGGEGQHAGGLAGAVG
jgi:hypothetical protein